jgi:hypothetical protein
VQYFPKEAKAATRGTKRKKNSADLAARSESVLREFLKSKAPAWRDHTGEVLAWMSSGFRQNLRKIRFCKSLKTRDDMASSSKA